MKLRLDGRDEESEEKQLTELAFFLAAAVDKYSCPGLCIGWTIVQADEDPPVHWLCISDHPKPTNHLDLAFFVRLNWVESMPTTKSLYNCELADGGRIIEMDGSVDWKTEVTKVIEDWLEYVDGKPTRNPVIKL